MTVKHMTGTGDSSFFAGRRLNLSPAWAVPATLCCLLMLDGCGPGVVFNLEGQYEQYSEIYEATTSDRGLGRLKWLISDVPEHVSIGVASQELPVPSDLVWSKLVANLEAIRTARVHQDPERRFLSTAFFLSARALVNLSYDRLFVTLEPTEYGTTVVHLGLLRNVEIWERRDPETGEWRVSPLAGEPPDYRQVERTLDASHASRLAVVMLKRIATELVSEDGLAELPKRVQELKERHRLSTTAPSSLELTATLDDSDSLLPNGIIDPGESGRFRLTLTNAGPGTAYAVAVQSGEDGARLGLPEELAVGDLEPGATRELSVPFGTATDIAPESLTVSFQAFEERDYRSAPFELVVPVAPLVLPSLRIASVRIDDRTEGDGDGRLGSGETAVLEVTIENAGPGPAAGVMLSAAAEEGDVTIDRGAAEFGAIPAAGSGVARVPVSVSPTARAGDVELHLVAEDGRGSEVARAEWTSSLAVAHRFPLLELSHRLYDGDSAASRGNRDGVVNNGEGPELELRVSNRGRLVAEAVQAEIELFPADVHVEPRRIDLGDLPPLSEGAVHRVRLDVPRGLDHVGPMRATVVLHQRHFPPLRQPVELPFTPKRPDLRVGPRTLTGLAPGRLEERDLMLQNVGDLAAEGVEVRVRSGDPRLELLDAGGSPTPEVALLREALDLDSSALRVPLRLISKGDLQAGAAELRVEVRQDDFPPTAETVVVEVEPRAARRVEVAPARQPTRGAPGPAEDRTGPVIWILEPGAEAHQGGPEASLTVRSAQVRVRGRVSDTSGVYRVTVGDEAVTVDPHGTFTSWVRLGFGENPVRVAAEDRHGNVGVASFTVVRSGDAGRPRRDRALFFATDRYDQWPRLENPISDARTLAATLEASFGFETEVVTNPTQVDVRRRLRRYVEEEPGPEDQLLVFFAGHGHFDELSGAGYLVTSESRRGDELGQSYLAFSELANILDNLPHRHLLVVLDACYGGTFDQSLSRARGPDDRREGWTERQIAEKLAAGSRLYLAAGGRERVDDGPAGAHSPFVRRLLAALHRTAADGRPLTSRGLFALMDVPSPLDPEPRAGEFGDHEPGGEFLFVPRGR